MQQLEQVSGRPYAVMGEVVMIFILIHAVLMLDK